LTGSRPYLLIATILHDVVSALDSVTGDRRALRRVVVGHRWAHGAAGYRARRLGSAICSPVRRGGSWFHDAAQDRSGRRIGAATSWIAVTMLTARPRR
jgi:hypothetical protein